MPGKPDEFKNYIPTFGDFDRGTAMMEKEIAGNPRDALQIRAHYELAMSNDRGSPLQLEAWRERNADQPFKSIVIHATSLTDGTDEFTRDIGAAFARRGDAYFAAGKYVEAVHDYACAILQKYHPGWNSYERYPSAASKRSTALSILRSFFSAGNVTVESSDYSDLPVPMIPAGHLVIGDGNVLFRFRPDEEGREEAIACAESLGRDSAVRDEFDNCYLVDDPDFSIEVFVHDGKRPTRIHVVRNKNDQDEGQDKDKPDARE